MKEEKNFPESLPKVSCSGANEPNLEPIESTVKMILAALGGKPARSLRRERKNFLEHNSRKFSNLAWLCWWGARGCDAAKAKIYIKELYVHARRRRRKKRKKNVKRIRCALDNFPLTTTHTATRSTHTSLISAHQYSVVAVLNPKFKFCGTSEHRSSPFAPDRLSRGFDVAGSSET